MDNSAPLTDYDLIAGNMPARGGGKSIFTDSAGRASDNLGPNTLRAFEQAAIKYQVPADILMGVAEKDSGFDAFSQSQGLGPKTRGIISLNDADVAKSGINPYETDQAVGYAAQKFKSFLDQGMSVPDAVKAMKFGPNRDAWGPEAENYANDVLGRAQKLSQTYFPAPEAAPEAPKERPGYMAQFGADVSRGFSNLKNIGIGAAGLVADVAGFDDYATSLLNSYVENEKQLAKDNPAVIGSYEKIGGLDDAARYAIEAVGENVAMFLPSLATGGIGAAVAKRAAQRGVTALIEDQVAKGVARDVASKNAAEFVSRRLATGAAGGAYASSAPMEAGSIYGDIYEKTGERRPGLAAGAGAVAGALDVVEPVMAITKIAGSRVADGLTKSLVRRLGEEGAKQFFVEAGTEGAQTIIENMASLSAQGKDLTSPEVMDGVVDSMLKGGIGGGVMGVASQGVEEVRAALKRREPTLEGSVAAATPEAEAAIKDVAAGAPGRQTSADLAAVDDTPERKPAGDGPMSRAMQAGAPHMAPAMDAAGKRVVITDEVGSETGTVTSQDADGILFQQDDGFERFIPHADIAAGRVGISQGVEGVQGFGAALARGPMADSPPSPAADYGFTQQNLDDEAAYYEERASEQAAEPPQAGAQPAPEPPPIAEPPARKTLEEMSEPELRGRLKALAEQARAAGGWNGSFMKMRREIEQQITARQREAATAQPATMPDAPSGSVTQNGELTSLPSAPESVSQPNDPANVARFIIDNKQVKGWRAEAKRRDIPPQQIEAIATELKKQLAEKAAEKAAAPKPAKTTAPKAESQAETMTPPLAPNLAQEDAKSSKTPQNPAKPGVAPEPIEDKTGWKEPKRPDEATMKRLLSDDVYSMNSPKGMQAKIDMFGLNDTHETYEKPDKGDGVKRFGIREKAAEATQKFDEASGTLGVPRAEMPQVKSEHHGALTNFLNAKGIEHETTQVPADSLKPTQAEFSPEKVEKAKQEGNGDRAVIVSEDGHVIDGHHQWLAAKDQGENVKAIVLKTDAETALEATKAFPSATTAQAPESAPQVVKNATPTVAKTQGEISQESGVAPAAAAPAPREILPASDKPDGGFKRDFEAAVDRELSALKTQPSKEWLDTIYNQQSTPEHLAAATKKEADRIAKIVSKQEKQPFSERDKSQGDIADLYATHSAVKRVGEKVASVKASTTPAPVKESLTTEPSGNAGEFEARAPVEPQVDTPAPPSEPSNSAPAAVEPPLPPAALPENEKTTSAEHPAATTFPATRLKAANNRQEFIEAARSIGEEANDGDTFYDPDSDVTWTIRKQISKNGTEEIRFEISEKPVFGFNRNPSRGRPDWQTTGDVSLPLNLEKKNTPPAPAAEEKPAKPRRDAKRRETKKTKAKGQEPEAATPPEPAATTMQADQPAGDIAPSPATQPEQQPLAPAPANLVEQFRDKFLESTEPPFKTIVDARKFARENGLVADEGKAWTKVVDETIEHGLVLAARQLAEKHRADPQEAFKQIVALYNRQPNLGSRTSESIAEQAYSTPAPLAYVASRLAGITGKTTVLEPTAGNGMLLMEAAPAKTTANELNDMRRSALDAQGFKTSDEDAAEAKFDASPAVDVVIANPPFGAVKEAGESKVFKVDRFETTQIDHAISLNALKAMKPDGRAVLIIGGIKAESDAERAKGYGGKAKRTFFYKLLNEYNVTDIFTVSGDLYAKQGAGWPVDVIVIDGKGASSRAPLTKEPPPLLNSWEQVGEKLNEQRSQDGETARGNIETGGEPGGVSVAEKPEPTSRNDGGGEGAIRGESVSGEPKKGRPKRVGGASNRGESGPVRTEQPMDAGAPAQAARRGNNERVDYVPDPERGRAVAANEAGQAPYRPSSKKGVSLGTLVPANLRTATAASLDRVQRQYGQIDSFVANELGYDVDDLGKYFSAEQVDAIGLGISNIDKGDGFIIGDQTGIGKGRVVAAMISYAKRKGMTPVFVTEKPDLYGDMWRDLHDIGWNEKLGREINIFMTNSGARVPLDEEAVEWAAEAEQARMNGEPIPERRGQFTPAQSAEKADARMAEILRGEESPDVVFTTYDQMNSVRGMETSRRNFLRQIAPQSFLIMDEAHNAGGSGGGEDARFTEKGAPPRSKVFREVVGTAQAVMYSSATYAKSPRVMDLFSRTDMAKAVDKPAMLPELIAKGGVPLQQVVSSMLSDSGQYLRRERSFEGVTYDPETVPVDAGSYASFTNGLRAIFEFDRAFSSDRKDIAAEMAAEIGGGTGKDGAVGDAGASATEFSSIMHNIIGQMVLAIKAEKAGQRAVEAIKAGEKPVIALSKTNESFIKDFISDQGIKVGDTINLSFGDILNRYLERTRRITIKTGNNEKKHVMIPLSRMGVHAIHYNDVIKILQGIQLNGLPVSPIDAIRHEIEKAGYSVREITGRSYMVDYSSAEPVLKDRPRSEQGSAGKRVSVKAFNDGKVDVLILNKSGSTGISMHASSKFKDQRKRRMILVEADPNIDTHMQMLGRVHRTGQVLTPAYTQLAADIPAEVRPTANLMRKMASLNANTTGAKKSKFSSESVDFMNKYGDRVIAEILRDDIETNIALGEPINPEGGEESLVGAIAKVTGRLTLLDPAKQQELIDRITSNYSALIERLDAEGVNDLEAKSIDLQARVLESSTVKPPSGPSPFQSAVTMDKVSIKSQGRAMEPAEVLRYASEAVKEKLDADAEFATNLKKLAKAGEEKHTDLIEKTRLRTLDRLKQELAVLKEEEAKEKAKKKLNDTFRRWRDIAQTAYPGAIVNVQFRGQDMPAVVIGFDQKGDAKNPVAMSSWTLSLALPDSARSLGVPLSQVFTPSNPSPDGSSGVSIAPNGSGRFATQPEDIAQLFEAARKEGRETRFMFSGNILAAYDQTRGQGQIINHTMEDGSTRPAILMNRTFDPGVFMSERAVRFKTGEQVLKFLNQISRGEVSSTDGVVTVRTTNRGDVEFDLPSAKATGGKYFADSVVRKVYDAWEKRGSRMRAVVTTEKARQIIDAMMSIDAVFETKENQKEAEAIIGASAEQPKPSIGRSAGMSAADLRDMLTRGVSGRLVKAMIDSGAVVLHDTAATAPGFATQRGPVQAAVTPDGVIHMVAGNLDDTTARGVLLHEAFHAGGQSLLGEKAWRNLLDRIGQMARSPREGGWLAAAKARAEAAGVDPQHFAEEIAAYAIENAENAPVGIQEIADRIVGAVKAFVLRKFGKQFGAVTPGQLRSLAVSALRSAAVPQAADRQVYSNGPMKGFIVYHGSPHSFDRFDMSKIGTGEGAQAYGHGLYFAQNEDVAKQYREFLSSRSNDLTDPGNLAASLYYRTPEGTREAAIREAQTVLNSIDRMPAAYKHDPGVRERTQKALEMLQSGAELPKQGGSMYQVRINADPEHFLDWDKPLSEQPGMLDRVSKALPDDPVFNAWKQNGALAKASFASIYKGVAGGTNADIAAGKTAEFSQRLKEAGFPGIKYLDQGSRGKGDGSRNYVLFDDSLIQIENKYSIGRTAGAAVKNAFNRSPDDKRTALGRAANLMSDIVTAAINGTGSDPGKIGVLALTPVRPLFTELSAGMPAARHYIDTKQAMDAFRNEMNTTDGKLMEGWIDWAKKNRDANDALVKVMFDATLDQYEPDPANAHTNDHANVALQKAYDALPKEAKKLYADVRDAYKARSDAMEKQIFANVKKTLAKIIKDAERRHAAELQRIEDEGLEGDAKKAAIEKADKALLMAQTRENQNRMARLKKMRDYFERNRLKGPYFPLARFGNYYVTLRDENGKVLSFEKYETPTAQREAADAYRKAYGEDAVEVGAAGLKTSEQRNMDPTFIAAVDSILEQGNVPASVRDQIYQTYLETMPDLSMRKHQIHRKNRPGFNEDAVRSYAHVMFHSAHQLARLKYGIDLQDHLAEASTQIKGSGDPVRNQAVYNEMVRAHDFAMNPQGSSFSYNVTSLVYLWTMAGNISTAMVNATQSVNVGIPNLAFDKDTSKRGPDGKMSHVGIKAAAKALANASIDFLRGKGSVLNSSELTDDERAAVSAVYDTGLIDATQAHDLAGVAEKGFQYTLNPVRNALSTALRWASEPMHQTERFNREITFLAAYRLARRAGMAHEPAIKKASDQTWATHFDNQASSKPRFARGEFGRMAFALRSYQANFLYRLFRDMHQSTNGLSPAEREIARKRFTAMMGITAAVAGVRGAPFYGALMMLAGAVFGALGKDDDDPEEALRKLVAETAGDSVAGRAISGMLLDGVPGYLTGTSLTNRVGQGDLWFRGNDRDLTPEQQWSDFITSNVTPLGVAHTVWQGLADIKAGNTERGVEKMLPASVKNFAKAWRYGTEGVQDKNGNPIVENVPIQDVLKQVIGFTPAEIADRMARNTFQNNMQDRIEKERTAARKTYARAVMKGDAEAAKEAMSAIDEYNQRRPQFPITGRSIMDSIKNMQRRKDRMEFGVDLDPKLRNTIKARTAPSIYDRTAK